MEASVAMQPYGVHTMKTRIVTCLIIATIGAGLGARASAQNQFRVLPADFNSDLEQQMMRAFLRKQVHRALDSRLETLQAVLDSPERISAYQSERRDFLRRTLGEMPLRTPLNSRVTGTLEGDGFTIEKVLFESQPGFHVTGNLYRPQGQGPFPAILHPCGHSENGKAAGVYQLVNRLLAKNGFIVLCYDPIGQGERKQILAADGTPTHRPTGEHQQLGVAGILLGRSLASYMVWDGVRGIDYLQSRSDVDPHRIGCTGNSGGGNMTSYLMAYDERIAAAAPGCFMTTHRRKNERPGPGDAEQNLYRQIVAGFDHPDFILTRAPKPTLILAATRDYVPIEGAWEAFRQAKRIYAQLGYPERVDLVETNAKHGFSRRLREGAVRFFARWLQGRQIEEFEENDAQVTVRQDSELQVTPAGQVRQLTGSVSIFELYGQYERELAAQRPRLTREVVREATGIRLLSQLPEPTVEALADNDLPKRLIFRPEEGILLPALFWPDGDRQAVLIAHDAGMNAAVREAESLHASGHPVLVVDVRDIGETKTQNWRFYGADFYIGYMLGRSWLAMRAEDLLVCARWLGEQRSVPVRLVAHGEIGPAASHAAALEAKLFASVGVKDQLSSWRQLMSDTAANIHLHNAVHGALSHYDLPDLMSLTSK